MVAQIAKVFYAFGILFCLISIAENKNTSNDISEVIKYIVGQFENVHHIIFHSLAGKHAYINMLQAAKQLNNLVFSTGLENGEDSELTLIFGDCNKTLEHILNANNTNLYMRSTRIVLIGNDPCHKHNITEYLETNVEAMASKPLKFWFIYKNQETSLGEPTSNAASIINAFQVHMVAYWNDLTPLKVHLFGKSKID